MKKLAPHIIAIAVLISLLLPFRGTAEGDKWGAYSRVGTGAYSWIHYFTLPTGSSITGDVATLATGTGNETQIARVAEAGNETVTDTTSATTWVALWNNATGSQKPHSDAALTYDASTGALSATSFVSTAADGTHYVSAYNTSANPTCNSGSKGYLGVVGSTPSLQLCSGSAWADVILAGTSTQSLNLITTGTIQGAIKVIGSTDGYTDNQTIADDNMSSMCLVQAAKTMTLPATGIGKNICFMATRAVTFLIRPNAADGIKIGGAARLADQVAIKNTTGAEGDFVCLFGDNATGWHTLGKSGTWATE